MPYPSGERKTLGPQKGRGKPKSRTQVPVSTPDLADNSSSTPMRLGSLGEGLATLGSL